MTPRQDPGQPKNQNVVFGLAWYEREQWQQLTAVVEDRNELNDTYEQWERCAREALRNCERQGQKVKKVHVNVEALVSWCKANGLSVNSKAQSEYVATVLRQRNGPKGTSTLIIGLVWSAITTILCASTPLASGRFMSFTLVAIIAAILAMVPMIRGQKRIGIAAAIVFMGALTFALINLPDAVTEAGKYGKGKDGSLRTKPR